MSHTDRYGLDAVEAEDGREHAQRASAFKMVEAFAGITRRRLWLKSGAPAHTDGSEVVVPLEDPAAYKILEHQLSHILFRTDPQARKTFIAEYTRRVADLVAKSGEPLDEAQQAVFETTLSNILDAVECRRVESLWSLLYEGSYRFGREHARAGAEALLPAAHDSFANFLSVIEAGEDPGSGNLERFYPYCVEAFRKAEYRGYNATLVVSKWLVSHLVSEMLREARDQPPHDDADKVPDLVGDTMSEPGDPKAQPAPKPKSEAEDGDAEDPQADGAPGNKSEDREGESVGNSGQIPDEEKGDSDGEGKPDDNQRPGSGKWSPPTTQATPEERAKALKDLLDRLGQESPKKKQRSRFEDIKEPPAPERGAVARANQMVSDALKADVSDSKALDNALDASRQDMQKLLDQARRAFRQQMSHDDWLRKDAHAKVVFRDVRLQDVNDFVALKPEDQVAVQRLRAIFNRVMGRRRVQLEEDGTEIDIGAYIDRKVTHAQVPAYRHEVRGRGFKPLLLIDRSGSMSGDKQVQAERTARIVMEALRYPFVDPHIWGFQSLANGQIDITRYDRKVRAFDSEKSKVGGFTPLHLAIHTALRFLERGSETKHLFVLTDGFPVYSRKDGKSYSTKQLLMFVRDEVQQARQQGISTSGAIIGSRSMLYGEDGKSDVHYDLGPKELRFMFGPPRFWRQLDPRSFGQDLVQLVASSFLDYLNRA